VFLRRRTGALEETEVHHWCGDLAVFNQEQTVAREAGMLQGLLVDKANVPEMRHEQTALHARDQLVERLGRRLP
jgi:hypothetical protein